MNIKQVLEYGTKLLKENGIDEPILKARILLANILEQSKEYLTTHETEEQDRELVKVFKEGIDKLCNNIPIQYITKKQEFMGLDFIVNENVLIPRPDTEILVEEVIKLVKQSSNPKILDLCTGSGAIGISIAKYIDDCKVILSDISNEALKIATQNCISILGKDKNNKIQILQSDLFKNIREKKFDIIVSNPPYIKTAVIKTLEKQVQNEPIIALDGGKDGLDIYKKIINQAYKFLKKEGYLCLEIGYDQKDEVIELIKKTNKYQDIYSKKDLGDNDRIVICKKEN